MPDADPCELCGSKAQTVAPNGGYDGIQQRCPRCGDFKLSGTARIRRVSAADKVKLSGWVRDQNQLGELPELTSDRIALIVASPLPGIVERADRLLIHAVKNQGRLGEWFDINSPPMPAVTYSADNAELMYLARFLNDEGLIKFLTIGGSAEITPRGYMRYEALQAHPSASDQGFVAMWFDDSMREAYVSGFEVGITYAGYVSLRVDSVEHVGKIDDEIIVQIKRSRFVVADCTGHRGGVYFEAGFAMGLNLPLILTCRRDHVSDLHFDIRQFNCIDWVEPGELADRLQRRIEAVVGRGPRELFRHVGQDGGKAGRV